MNRNPPEGDALDAELQRKLDWICARTRTVPPTVARNPAGAVVLRHRHLADSVVARTGLPASAAWDADERCPSAEFHHVAIRAVADVRRRDARAADIAAAGLGTDPKGRTTHVGPGWTHLVHPLHAYAIALSRMGTDHERSPILLDESTGASGTAHAVHDLLIGMRTMEGWGVTSNERATHLHILSDLPDTVLQTLPGRPVSAVLEIVATGIPALDLRMADLRLAPATARPANPIPIGAPSIALAIEPTPWMRAGPDPEGLVPTYDSTHPFIA